MCTVLISILSIVKVGHHIWGSIICKLSWCPEKRTAARGLSWPYSRIGALLCSDSEYTVMDCRYDQSIGSQDGHIC